MRSTEEIIKIIESIRQRLPEISQSVKEYSDVAAAYERLNRWKERTTRFLNEQVSKTEADKFQQLQAPQGGTPQLTLRNEIKVYDAALLGIIETITYDPTFYWPDISTTDRISLHNQTPRENEFNQDVFISYSSLDEKEATMLYDAITLTGKLAFLSAKSINPGENFADKIRNQLIASRELWLLVSPNSLKSEWVLTEYGAAWILQKKVVPILHRCRPEDLPIRLRSIHSIDFYKYPELIKSTFQSA